MGGKERWDAVPAIPIKLDDHSARHEDGGADEINLAGLSGAPGDAKAMVKIDLSATAVSNIPILHTSRACTLLKALILYTEASSADAGVTIEIGTEGTAAYYYTGTSEVSQALWYELDATLLQTAIAAGDTVICGCAGAKVGTGEVLICIEYKVA